MQRHESLSAMSTTYRNESLVGAQPPPAKHSSSNATADAVETVAVGSTVEICYLESGDRDEYTLVPPSDADIRHNRISTFSPVGRAIYGHRVGDIVQVQAPSGPVEVRIESIRSDG